MIGKIIAGVLGVLLFMLFMIFLTSEIIFLIDLKMNSDEVNCNLFRCEFKNTQCYENNIRVDCADYSGEIP